MEVCDSASGTKHGANIAAGGSSSDGWESDGDEAAPVKIAQNPKHRCVEAVEIHNRTHNPYRDWCNWFVMGRGRAQPHSRAASAVPIVGMGYFFITADGVKTRKEF